MRQAASGNPVGHRASDLKSRIRSKILGLPMKESDRFIRKYTDHSRGQDSRYAVCTRVARRRRTFNLSAIIAVSPLAESREAAAALRSASLEHATQSSSIHPASSKHARIMGDGTAHMPHGTAHDRGVQGGRHAGLPTRQKHRPEKPCLEDTHGAGRSRSVGRAGG